MDLKNLDTFIQVAELGSFTRAAEKLGYSQPTVSFQIKQLEAELNIRLFDRIGHTVRLTEKGRDALAHAQRICHACQEMAEDSGEHRETPVVIRLAMADSLRAPLLGGRFATFRRQHPHISIQIATAGTTDLFSLLDRNEVDIVCTLDSRIYNTNYVTVSEEKVGVHFVVSAEHPLARQESVMLQELLAQPFLLTEKGMSYRRLLDEHLARESLEVHPVLEMSSAYLLCGQVEEGVGVSFLPDYATEAAVRRGRVVRLNVPGMEVELWNQILYHRDKWVSRQMQAVLDHLSGILLKDAVY